MPQEDRPSPGGDYLVVEDSVTNRVYSEPMGCRDKVWGMDRDAEWESVLPEDGLDGIEIKGKWTRHGDRVKCEAGEEGAHLVFGGHDWRDYEIKCRVEAEKGGNVQIVFQQGRFALTVWNGKTAFEKPMARRLA